MNVVRYDEDQMNKYINKYVREQFIGIGINMKDRGELLELY